MVILQLLGVVDIVFVASFGITNDIDLKDVEDSLAMVVKGANSQIVTIAIAQSAPLPEAIHLLVGQTSIATELLDQPDVAPKDICCHILNYSTSHTKVEIVRMGANAVLWRGVSTITMRSRSHTSLPDLEIWDSASRTLPSAPACTLGYEAKRSTRVLPYTSPPSTSLGEC